MSRLLLYAEGVCFEADRKLLARASPVFADLLRLPGGDAESSIVLAGDTVHDVKHFLASLAKASAALESNTTSELLGIARLAHKYECDSLATTSLRLLIDSIRTSIAPLAILSETLAIAARFGPADVAALSAAFLARRDIATTDPLQVLAACDHARVHAPALQGWALYSLVQRPWRTFRRPLLTPELRTRLLLGETALRELPDLSWSTIPHTACARAWANAWSESAVTRKVDKIRAWKAAEAFTLKRVAAGGTATICRRCTAASSKIIRLRIEWLQQNIWLLFDDHGVYFDADSAP
ncbi:hypothetical protein EXIGLDRAFT_737565 [Exidia glandulosa HHB12029]|uniref:BTB domain-containing protein n=1 Tax=Exidia glandulosa HHB12029 TaxID=1314781 RepID=A0A165IWR5_EXIGL|nr:hypothetical protein EXIGLDRAFT_737565 [Exidia glandulosa HHB12029]